MSRSTAAAREPTAKAVGSRPARGPVKASAVSALPSSVQAVAVAFEVLEALANSAEPIGTSELARRLGKTKARVHRHLSTLRQLGFVDKDHASDGYRLGWKSYRLGISVADHFDLLKVTRRHLVRLHHDSAQTVALAIPAGSEISVVDAIQSTAHVAITIRPGSVIPSLSSALGRTILAFQSEAEQAAALALPIEPLTPNTPHAKQVRRLLDQVAKRWYEVAVNERLPGVAALAAPIFDDRNRVVAAVGVIGSQARVTLPPPQALIDQVQACAAEISAELGSSAWRTFQRQRRSG